MILRKHDMVRMASEEVMEGGGIHPYHEILYISSGSALLRWMGIEFPVQAPALFLLAPNTPHFLAKRSGECSFLYLELSVPNAADFPELPKMLAWNQLQCSEERLAPELSLVYAAARDLSEILSPLSPFAGAVEQVALLDVRKILLLIDHYLQPRTAKRIRGPEQAEARDRILDLMRLMESGYAHPYTVNQLAAIAHLEVSYFIRLFRSVAGTTPLQYLQDLRMKAAASFLSTTNKPVQDIAAATGFQGVHYFSRQFKKTYGVAPSAWRERERRSSD